LDHFHLYATLQECYARLANVNDMDVNITKLNTVVT
jgi:hypothetical protein